MQFTKNNFNIPEEIEKNIPESFLGKISQQIMIDPVIGPDGHSYERSFIENWLSKNNISPMTRQHMTVENLTPNRDLKTAIESYFSDLLKEKKISLEVFNSILKREEKSKMIETDIININLKKIFIDDEKNVLIRIDSNDVEIRPAINVSLCIDISGSTSTNVLNPESKKYEGVDVIDLLKRGANMIIETMGEKDRLGIVVYSSNSKVLYKLNYMNKSNKEEAKKLVNNLMYGGTTNMWSGLLNSLDMLSSSECTDTNSTILFLTDGLPNSGRGDRDEPYMIKKYKESKCLHKKLPCTIHTFGFGYDLDKELLINIAKEGSGTYNFIPDGSYVGTVFANSIANNITTYAKEAHLILIHKGKIINSPFDIETIIRKDDVNISKILLKTLHIGQSKNIFVEFDIPQDDIQVKLYFSHFLPNVVTEGEEILKSDKRLSGDQGKLFFAKIYAEARNLFCNGIKDILINFDQDNFEKGKDIFDILVNKFNSFHKAPYIELLIKNLKGQVKLSIIPEFFKKWGKYYLPSLLSAHLYEYRNNFSDFGENYRGELFERIVDYADDVFNKMNTPMLTSQIMNDNNMPVYRSLGNHYRGGSARSNERYTRSVDNRNVPTINYSNYNAVSGGGCITGDSLVFMGDGTEKRVSDIKKGDVVISPEDFNDKVNSKVLCVIKTVNLPDNFEIVKFDNGLGITPYHPVWNDREWKFPISIKKPVKTNIKEVYNFVLDSGHVMLINDFHCVTLGHGFEDNDVIKHDFFGNMDRIKRSLNRIGNFESGYIEMDHSNIERSSDGLVNDFR